MTGRRAAFAPSPQFATKKTVPNGLQKNWLGCLDSNQGNARSKIWCLAAWLHPSETYCISKYSKETSLCQIHRGGKERRKWSFLNLTPPIAPFQDGLNRVELIRLIHIKTDLRPRADNGHSPQSGQFLDPQDGIANGQLFEQES